MNGSVLVARQDNCGDVLLAGPAIRAVADAGRPVHLLCGPRGRAAAELLPGVDRIVEAPVPWIEPEPLQLHRDDADRLVATIARLQVREALILVSSHQSPLPLALLLRWAGVTRVAAVSHDHAGSLVDVRIPGDPHLHEVERNLAVAAALGYPPPLDDRLLVREPLDGMVPELRGLRPYVVVHPGASVPARTLPVDRWWRIVTELAQQGLRILVTGSERERRMTASVSGHHPLVTDLGGRTTFEQLAAVLGGAAAFVGGNTGPMHLAAAMGTPVVAVFPPTVPVARWHPWKTPHVVLGDQAIGCAGCRCRVCPLPDQPCLADVSPDAVAAAIRSLAPPAADGAENEVVGT